MCPRKELSISAILCFKRVELEASPSRNFLTHYRYCKVVRWEQLNRHSVLDPEALYGNTFF